MDDDISKLYTTAVETAKMIDSHKGIDTVLIDVSEVSSWTRFFIITSVMSSGHLRGLVKELRNYLSSKNIEINHKHKRIDEEGWELLDCGDLVIHLMSGEKREFYNLEKLWHHGKAIGIQPA